MGKRPDKRGTPLVVASEIRVVAKPTRQRRQSFKTASWGTVGRVAMRDGTSLEHTSSLERRWILFLDADPDASQIRYEPFTIEYHAVDGTRRPYTPDLIATFSPQNAVAKTVVFEVKESAELAEKSALYQERFAACTAYCQEQGWEFRVVTERDLPHPRLDNVLRLRRYRLDEHEPERLGALITRVGIAGTTTLEALLASEPPSREDRAITRAAVWHLVAAGRLWMDLDQPLSDSSPMRVAES